MTQLTLFAVFAICTFATAVQTPTLLPTVRICLRSSPDKLALRQEGMIEAALGAGRWSAVDTIVENAVLHFAMIARRKEMVPITIEHLPRSRYLIIF